MALGPVVKENFLTLARESSEQIAAFISLYITLEVGI